MNILNRGRCSRCIASKKESKIIKENEYFTQFTVWFKCTIKNNWCKKCALNCKEPPMGISANDFEKYYISKREKQLKNQEK